MERPETHTKRQATQHDCLPSFLGDGDTGIEIVYGEEKKYFVLGGLAAKAERKSPVLARQAQLRKDPFHLSLFESSFTFVSKVNRGTLL
jgi:hypothetical protein